MNVDLNDHEIEILLRALEEHRTHRQSHHLSIDEADELWKKLKDQQGPREAPSEGPQPA